MTAVSRPRPAAKNKPPPLAGTRLLVQFGVVLAAALVAVFPTRREYADLAASTKPNAYSIAYLKVLTRADPKDMRLHMIYARHLAALGEWNESLAAIEPVMGDATLGEEATDLKLDVLLSRARAIPEGDPARKAAFHDVTALLEKMADRPEHQDKLTSYAAMALELEEPALAARFYARAADGDQAHKTEYLELAARWYRAAGDNQAAAVAYERASQSVADPVHAERDAVLSLDSLEAADRVGDAFRKAKAYRTRYHDRAMLERTIALASAAGEVADARDLGRELLAQSPNDPALIEAQARRELWAGEPAQALPLIQRVRAMRPDDAALRELEAHVAEWSGRPELALDDWLWLLTHGRTKP